MAESPLIPLPEGSLRLGGPPHLQGLPGVVPLSAAFLLAAAAPLAAGVTLFGWHAVRLLAISVATAVLIESLINLLRGSSRSWSESHALLTGVLFACTLPPQAPWQAALIGSMTAVIVGHVLFGGVGNYLWHPVALGRVAVQIIFDNRLTGLRWPVLAPGRLGWGSLDKAQELPPLAGWNSAHLDPGIQAWLTVPPVERLRDVLPGSDGLGATLARLVRDQLPSWTNSLWGVAGGGIGEACMMATILAGLVLLWRGFLRWPMVIGGLAAAAACAAILPVQVRGADGSLTSYLFPIRAMYDGLPVGVVYVAYHLVAGELLFVLLVLAPDPSSSPLTSRGHLIFGVFVGVAAMSLRMLAGLPVAAVWALLLANTTVPLIDRFTRRRVFGT